MVARAIRRVCGGAAFRNLGIGIVRMRPVVIRSLLLPLAIDPRQVGARGRSDPGRLRELRQEVFIGLATVASHNAPQRRVRFERRGIDADRLAFDQAGRTQAL